MTVLIFKRTNIFFIYFRRTHFPQVQPRTRRCSNQIWSPSSSTPDWLTEGISMANPGCFARNVSYFTSATKHHYKIFNCICCRNLKVPNLDSKCTGKRHYNGLIIHNLHLKSWDFERKVICTMCEVIAVLEIKWNPRLSCWCYKLQQRRN